MLKRGKVTVFTHGWYHNSIAESIVFCNIYSFLFFKKERRRFEPTLKIYAGGGRINELRASESWNER